MKLTPIVTAAAWLFTVALTGCSSATTTSVPTDGGGADASDGGGPPPIHANDYNQSCTAPTDCAIVDEGDVCGCGSCGNAAINKSDLAKYEAEVAARVKQCPSGGRMVCPAGACILSETTCIANKCGVCHSPGCGTPDAGGDAASDAAHD